MEPCILEERSPQRDSLEIAAKLLTRFNRKNYIYHVGETYFDFGLDWSWTTILAHDAANAERTWQALSPKEWKDIIEASTSDELMKAIVDFMKEHDLNEPKQRSESPA